ncbi:MAG: AAA family ATPase [Tissierellales bacterium]|jgi:energy-coupling factor transporter ATP-binding protein EcfA2|nr:AAA family ATPase [Tissierellales bacterium]
MICNLIVYDKNNLKKVEEEYKNRSVVSFSSTYLENYESKYGYGYDDKIIDLTGIYEDKKKGKYFFTDVERMIYEKLSELDYETFFSIRKDLHKELVEDLFNFFDEVIDLSDNKNLSSETYTFEPVLYSYKDVAIIKDVIQKESLISFSIFFDKYLNMTLKNLSEIMEVEDIVYIDLTSLAEDLVKNKFSCFMIETFFREIPKVKEILYIVDESKVEDIIASFPFVFDEVKSLSDIVEMKETLVEVEEVVEKKEMSIEKIVENCDMFSKKLYGHNKFKEDLKISFINFYYLNKLGRRKIQSIFICGTSGIGKTEVARMLSKIMYPNENQVKINFGNYSSQGVLNSLIGSPLGYIGSDEGGELINKIKSSDSRIILIDEFEKADSTVYNFFYELLEDGQFTDRKGEIHDLNGYTIIFTSNLDKTTFKNHIPEPLRSRFDMKVFFEQLNNITKKGFIINYSEELLNDIQERLQVDISQFNINEYVEELMVHSNLREIKRLIEDKVFRYIINRGRVQ